MPKEDDKSCCCNHGHTPDCLFVDFVKKQCGGDYDKACQLLHQDNCGCYSKILRAQSEMLYDEDKANAGAKTMEE